MTAHLELQIACENTQHIPVQNDFNIWVNAALEKEDFLQTPELTLRIVDKVESETLNANYRQQHKPTNVLSFPFEAMPHQEINYLGDLAICAPLVIEEAQAQNKTILSHWAHLTIHGVLHLLGYDHEKDQEAEEMESLEIEILNKLGYENPYL